MMEIVLADKDLWMAAGPHWIVSPCSELHSFLNSKARVYGRIVGLFIARLQRWPEGVSPLMMALLLSHSNSDPANPHPTPLPIELVARFNPVAGKLFWPWMEWMKLSGDEGVSAPIERINPLFDRVEGFTISINNRTVSFFSIQHSALPDELE